MQIVVGDEDEAQVDFVDPNIENLVSAVSCKVIMSAVKVLTVLWLITTSHAAFLWFGWILKKWSS